jgi:hypothetical protein
MSSQKEIANCCSAAFLMDTFPQETFDGFWCINESSKGRNNFRNICEFFSQHEDGENTLLKLFRENNGENLMRHPLLCMENTELLDKELITTKYQFFARTISRLKEITDCSIKFYISK